MIPTTATIRRLAGACRRRWSGSTAASLSTVAQGNFLQQGDPSDIICNNVSRAKVRSQIVCHKLLLTTLVADVSGCGDV